MTDRARRRLMRAAPLVAAAGTAGCGPLERMRAVPAAAELRAEIDGMPGIRYRVGSDADLRRLAREFIESWRREQAWLQREGRGAAPQPAAFLALSGGGDQGAFGAGLLNGWSDAGTRPEFKLVTGISTGALIAPFAFIGRDGDARLKEFYTRSRPEDVLRLRSLMSMLTLDAIADVEPLVARIRENVDERLLAQIAEGYARGRELWIATTDLDARKQVIWNMTRIAASGHPDALALFRALMLASASIPGAFPPVMIDVGVDGRRHQEMHVDGGAMAQVFVYPSGLDLDSLAREYGMPRERRLYVVRNSRVDADWAEVARSTVSIVQRAINAMIQTQGIGDLYRIFVTARRDGLDYNLAHIPASFEHPHRYEFDPIYMNALYDIAYKLGRDGYPWAKSPPNFMPGYEYGPGRS